MEVARMPSSGPRADASDGRAKGTSVRRLPSGSSVSRGRLSQLDFSNRSTWRRPVSQSNDRNTCTSAMCWAAE